jgi:hypothetical protein
MSALVDSITVSAVSESEVHSEHADRKLAMIFDARAFTPRHDAASFQVHVHRGHSHARFGALGVFVGTMPPKKRGIESARCSIAAALSTSENPTDAPIAHITRIMIRIFLFSFFLGGGTRFFAWPFFFVFFSSFFSLSFLFFVFFK